MKILVVDDERLARLRMEKLLETACPGAVVYFAANYMEAMKMPLEQIHVAFLDIEMPKVNGIELAKMIQEVNPTINIIFVTAYSTFALEAYKLYASGYVEKPCTVEMIQKEMAHLRYPIVERHLLVRCFGNFEAFCEGESLYFKRRAAKDILAYLVHLRGSSASTSELIAVLWEDEMEADRRRDYFRSLIASLRATLKSYNLEDVFINRRDHFAINVNLIDCDYYRYINGDKDPIIQFRGEYMNQYSWGEETKAALMRMQH